MFLKSWSIKDAILHFMGICNSSIIKFLWDVTQEKQKQMD